MTRLLIGVTIFVRAAVLGFTHDESLTYLNFVCADVAHIFTFQGDHPANNHMLNSLLAKASVSVFGTSELSLRFPNILAYLFYLLASCHIYTSLKGGLAGFGCFLLLNLSPFVLDFFSLCRGYGLAMAGTLWSLALLLRRLQSGDIRVRDALVITSAASLSVFAHLAFLNFFLSLCCALFVVEAIGLIRDARNSFWKKLGRLVWLQVPALLNCLILACFFLLPIWLLKLSYNLFYGGMTGVWTDTIPWTIRALLYGIIESAVVVGAIRIFVVAVVILASLVFLREAIQKRFAPPKLAAISVVLILLFSLLAVNLEHLLFTDPIPIPFPSERTGMYLLPLFVLTLSCLFAQTAERRPVRLAWVILLGLLCTHFLWTVNLTHTYTWRADAEVREMIAELEKLHDANSRTIRVWAHVELEPPLNFYRETGGLSWLEQVVRQPIKDGFDCYATLQKEWDMLRDAIPRLTPIRRFGLSGTVLAR